MFLLKMVWGACIFTGNVIFKIIDVILGTKLSDFSKD